MDSLTTSPDKKRCCLGSTTIVFFAIFESGNMVLNSFPTWSAVAFDRLCSQINPENSNSAFINFSSITNEFPEESKIVIFWVEADAFIESACSTVPDTEVVFT